MQGMYGDEGTTVQGSWEDAIRDWPDENKQQVRYFADKYGPPTSVCGNSMTWYNNAPWKRTMVYKMSAPHDFPAPHRDIIKQTIDYRVPVEKCTELIEFDGSLLIDRTTGELSARCGNEAMSYLGFNLANQVVTNQTDVQGARRQAAEAIDTYMRGEQTPTIMQGLQFDVARGGTADPDHPMMAAPSAERTSMGGGGF